MTAVRADTKVFTGGCFVYRLQEVVLFTAGPAVTDSSCEDISLLASSNMFIISYYYVAPWCSYSCTFHWMTAVFFYGDVLPPVGLCWPCRLTSESTHWLLTVSVSVWILWIKFCHDDMMSLPDQMLNSSTKTPLSFRVSVWFYC